MKQPFTEAQEFRNSLLNQILKLNEEGFLGGHFSNMPFEYSDYIVNLFSKWNFEISDIEVIEDNFNATISWELWGEKEWNNLKIIMGVE